MNIADVKKQLCSLIPVRVRSVIDSEMDHGVSIYMVGVVGSNNNFVHEYTDLGDLITKGLYDTSYEVEWSTGVILAFRIGDHAEDVNVLRLKNGFPCCGQVSINGTHFADIILAPSGEIDDIRRISFDIQGPITKEIAHERCISNAVYNYLNAHRVIEEVLQFISISNGHELSDNF